MGLDDQSAGGQLLPTFASMFGGAPRLYRAPGRVNLIGEHTDYNDGWVMPCAIAFSCWAAAAPRRDHRVRVHSLNMAETVEFDLTSFAPAAVRHWSEYVRGVALELQRGGAPMAGADLLVWSDVPLGAGLSSSAALEVAVAYALLGCVGATLQRTDIARLCQRAEHVYAGARCGIMDQFIACHAERGTFLLLDCRSLAARSVALPPGLGVVICNTMVKHAISGGEYNQRRAQCEEGVRRLAERLPGMRALRDVTPAELEQHRDLLPDIVYRRCRHVVTENARVEATAAALAAGDLAHVGRCMAGSHQSLRDDYEVSCAELDVMVEAALQQPGTVGARMTGGGFGGCTVNLVEGPAVPGFQRGVAAAYAARTGIRPAIYVTTPAAGAGAWTEARAAEAFPA